jgi:glycine/D-amino acid oxidase-like deaminating enzyme
VVVLNNTEVEEIKDSDSKVYLKIKNNFQNFQNIYFEASKVAICTNAFASEMFSRLNINAGRGQVLITKPIKNLPFRGNFHFDEGYYYFRDVDGERVLFGGGRNLDFKGENTTTFATTDKILNELVEKLSTIILPNQTFEIAQTWAGIMAFNTEKTPIVCLHTPNVALGVCLNGMGVAIGSIVGQETADLLV